MSKPKFELEVLCFTRPNLRDESLQYESHIGYYVLQNCFDKFETDYDTKEVFLSFPEKFLNILEQRMLIQRLEKFYPNLKKVTIKTHSVYIIQTVHSENIHIVDEGNIPETIEGKLYHEDMTFNLFDSKKLNVIGGEIK